MCVSPTSKLELLRCILAHELSASSNHGGGSVVRRVLEIAEPPRRFWGRALPLINFDPLRRRQRRGGASHFPFF